MALYTKPRVAKERNTAQLLHWCHDQDPIGKKDGIHHLELLGPVVEPRGVKRIVHKLGGEVCNDGGWASYY